VIAIEFLVITAMPVKPVTDFMFMADLGLDTEVFIMFVFPMVLISHRFGLQVYYKIILLCINNTLSQYPALVQAVLAPVFAGAVITAGSYFFFDKQTISLVCHITKG